MKRISYHVVAKVIGDGAEDTYTQTYTSRETAIARADEVFHALGSIQWVNVYEVSEGLFGTQEHLIHRIDLPWLMN